MTFREYLARYRQPYGTVFLIAAVLSVVLLVAMLFASKNARTPLLHVAVVVVTIGLIFMIPAVPKDPRNR